MCKQQNQTEVVIEINSGVSTPDPEGVYSVDLQANYPALVGKPCSVKYDNFTLEMSDRITNIGTAMVANATVGGGGSTDLVVKAVSTLKIGPVGTTGTLAVGASAVTAFTVSGTATILTLASALTWAEDDVVAISTITNGGDHDYTKYPMLSVHTNMAQKHGTTLLMPVENYYAVTNGTSDISIVNKTYYSREFSSVVPSRVEVWLSSLITSYNKIGQTSNPFRLTLILTVSDH